MIRGTLLAALVCAVSEIAAAAAQVPKKSTELHGKHAKGLPIVVGMLEDGLDAANSVDVERGFFRVGYEQALSEEQFPVVLANRHYAATEPLHLTHH